MNGKEVFEKSRVLITVMTYPHPSEGYKELVCTAGISEDGKWVRLYPIDYRYMPADKQFRKYQWIEIALSPRGKGNDKRPESRKPNLDSIKIIGEPLPTAKNWEARRKMIDAMPHHTLNQLKASYENDQTSLGIVRPRKILDLEVTPDKSTWKPAWENLFKQQRLFGEPQKPLRKIPYKFQYVFECEDSQKPHRAMIEDWELGVLFLKEAKRLGSDEAAAKSVKEKFLNELCAEDRDTRFFMGTTFPYNTWLVLGVFWPPKQKIDPAPSKKKTEGSQGKLF